MRPLRMLADIDTSPKPAVLRSACSCSKASWTSTSCATSLRCLISRPWLHALLPATRLQFHQVFREAQHSLHVELPSGHRATLMYSSSMTIEQLFASLQHVSMRTVLPASAVS